MDDWLVLEQFWLSRKNARTDPITPENIVAYAMFFAPGAVPYLCQRGFSVDGDYLIEHDRFLDRRLILRSALFLALLDFELCKPIFSEFLNYKPQFKRNRETPLYGNIRLLPESLELLLKIGYDPNQLQEKPLRLYATDTINGLAFEDLNKCLPLLLKYGMDIRQDLTSRFGFFLSACRWNLTPSNIEMLLKQLTTDDLKEIGPSFLKESIDWLRPNQVQAFLKSGIHPEECPSSYGNILTKMVSKLTFYNKMSPDEIEDYQHRFKQIVMYLLEAGMDGEKTLRDVSFYHPIDPHCNFWMFLPVFEQFKLQQSLDKSNQNERSHRRI